jgi:nicotinamide-nucleotide amidase
VSARADAAARLVARLRDVDLTVAVAESFTAGLATHHLIDVPDGGDVVIGGVVAYTPEAKQHLLGVDPGPVITEHCARQMAAGVQQLFGASCGLAFTGVAGPEPQEDQPVGTVFVAASCGSRVSVTQCELTGDPNEIRQAAITCAVTLLQDLVAETPR